ncbi:ump-cmp kinase [Cystoisospora suis]|uniref:UMP-CMP kinase n=1 Tax=Cystoisospora suis TaxID=483139 RepID=A0A2C6KSL8_9APIC|nr:ump-cmp kinase [Cystoisospora suis]
MSGAGCGALLFFSAVRVLGLCLISSSYLSPIGCMRLPGTRSPLCGCAVLEVKQAKLRARPSYLLPDAAFPLLDVAGPLPESRFVSLFQAPVHRSCNQPCSFPVGHTTSHLVDRLVSLGVQTRGLCEGSGRKPGWLPLFPRDQCHSLPAFVHQLGRAPLVTPVSSFVRRVCIYPGPRLTHLPHAWRPCFPPFLPGPALSFGGFRPRSLRGCFSRNCRQTSLSSAPPRLSSTMASSNSSCHGKPQIVFVLGGPGAGKGTQCELLTKHHNVVHISAGDCLREERQRPNSKDGELIQQCIREGRIVPVEITLTLLLKKMVANGWSRVFLIDGYPRNQDNLNGWLAFTHSENLIEKINQIRSSEPGLACQCDAVLRQLEDEVQQNEQETNEVNRRSGVDLRFCLFLDCPEETMEHRLLERGKSSGRADDNAEAIRKRFKTFKEETMPIVRYFEQKQLLKTIDASHSVEEVWGCVDPLFRSL